MRIFLIGFMGVGKTTFGKRLAKRLAVPFIDLDHLIEEHTGGSVADYFATHGEDAFRLLEKEILQQTNFPENAVISTGGGAPCFFDNMDWMNAQGKTIYIQMPATAIADRLKNAKEERPLIKGLKGESLINFIEERLLARELHYKKAHLTLNGHNLNPENVVELL
ncbi:shikimate kinase [Solitalea koreensis]|uniref:Shikimate kinase n=1 Tax=Solitalea koreensis TaxID=543615 RepID=A0A521CJ01_9SPHI|nr:shikimate kinase [Solitalea koreensis]SMO59355.1 shikimate kinase [Solitalea koreensis]